MTHTAPAAPPREDVLYPTNFYAYQAPVLLDYAVTMNGIAPPAVPGAPFTYLDLGCGDGFTAILLAAMHPEARFIGIDISPGHIAAGRRLAAESGLGNVALIEGDFQNWRSLDLPECDYIALHGVYTWIGDAGRAAVIDIARHVLRPGGLLYCGYNALPGWAAIVPLRHYFLAHTQAMQGDTTAKVAATLRHLAELKAKGAEFFRKHPTAAGFLDDMLKVDPSYLVHEIFPPEWSPLDFSTVLHQMRSAGLDFAGSADLAQNARRLAVRPEFLPHFLKESDFERRELYRDYVNNTFFRRDIYYRPRAEESRLPFETLATRPFGTKVPVRELSRLLTLPWGRIPIDDERFNALRVAFRGGTRTLEEIAADPGLARWSGAELVESVQILTFGLEVAPFLRSAETPAAEPEEWTVPLALNRALLAEPRGPEPFAYLASPSAGVAAVVTRNEALVLRAVAEAGRRGAAAWAWRDASERHRWLTRKGVPVRDHAKHLKEFAEILAGLGERLRKWVELGLIAPR